MNAAHPQYLPKFGKYRLIIGIVLVAIYPFAWFFDGIFIYQHRDLDPGDGLPGSHLLVILIALALGAASWRFGILLATGRRVLPAMQVPQTLGKAWQRSIMRNLWLDWGLAVAAGSTIFFSKEKNANWSSALFLYSTIVALCLAASLSRHGVLHRSCAWVIFFGSGLFLCIGGQDSYAYMSHLPVYWQLPLAATWPVLALLLTRTMDTPPAKLVTAGSAQKERTIVGRMNFKRYVLLNQHDNLSSRKPGAILWIPLSCIFTSSINQLHHAWGTGGGPLNIAIIVVLIPIVGETIYCKDLHWRRLLIPKGFGSGNIGWHLFFSTMTIYAMILFPLLLGYLALGCLLFGTPPQSMIEDALQHSSLLFELLFAVSIAIAWRSLTRWWIKRWWIVCVAFYLLLAIAFVNYLRTGMGNPTPVWFTIGPVYAATLSVASLAMLLLANRTWTMQRLLRFAVNGAG